MTIPTLINKIQKRTIEAQIKENYSMLSQTMRFSLWYTILIKDLFPQERTEA